MHKHKPVTGVFSVPLGTDFSKNFVTGLLERYAHLEPHEFAKIVIYLNTRRAARRVEDLLKRSGSRLLPQIRVITDLASDPVASVEMDLPASSLSRRLKLAKLVSVLIERQPDLAPRSSVFALADSLAGIMDEMQGEDVPFEHLKNLDIGASSEYWDRSLKFLDIITKYWKAQETIDTEARQRAVIAAYSKIWQNDPPKHPIIVAGSTGSRGATSTFMKSVLDHANGAIVLPGVDLDTPKSVWDVLTSTKSIDDHPQSMLARLTDKLGADVQCLTRWSAQDPVCAQRNKLVSLALRPAPITDQWLEEGPVLNASVPEATKDITVIAANSPKEEASAIALRLRKAAEDNQTAVLISPDRTLTRRVSSNLNRWGIIPDDSAGTPLHLSPEGIFLRLTAGLFEQELTPAKLIAILKHPMSHKALDRNNHLRFTRDLEMAQLNRNTPLIRGGPPLVDFELIEQWIERHKPDMKPWLDWLRSALQAKNQLAARTMANWVHFHHSVLEKLSRGSLAEKHVLWDGKAGPDAKKIFDDLIREADDTTEWSASDYSALLYSLLKSAEVRDAISPHPKIAIWGTLEARVQGAEVVILGGLNEGVWPQSPTPDPWLNRSMRKQLGLLLPERNIGLSAHDFQQAIAQKTVILSRAIRDGEAPTVASRWITRISNLMNGIGPNGDQAWQDMNNRGMIWLDYARALDRPAKSFQKTKRPAPIPPSGVYPKRLSVTRIQTLVRNPYEIYAQSILNLRPVKPYGKEPDALARGTVLHAVIETFNRAVCQDNSLLTPDAFLKISREVLQDQVPWSSARKLWFGRLERIANWFVSAEIERHNLGTLKAQEIKGTHQVKRYDFTLSAIADRIDLDENGGLIIYDYKSGEPSSKKEIALFDKQLQLEAAIAQAGGFEGIGPNIVSKLEYIGLKSPEKIIQAPIEDETWAEFEQLLACYFELGTGYIARQKMKKDRYGSDYDHLSRLGEWEETDKPDMQPVP